MKPIKNAIFGIKSTSLHQEEINFFKEVNPLGFIIYKRNIDNEKQIIDLIVELKGLVEHDYPMILIDQEGGRVARLRPPLFQETPSMLYFGEIALSNLDYAKILVEKNYFTIGSYLRKLGINMDCAPVADLIFNGADKVIGDRSFGSDPELVAELSKAADAGLIKSGIQSIIKHIPGHGRADRDSHFALPVVKADIGILEQTDFYVFKKLSHLKMAMTAHIIYEALDNLNPLTLSKIGINYIREKIGFNGLIMTDDISMKALSGGISHIIKKAIDAGCDIILHCNGDINEMREISYNLSALDEAQLVKIADCNCF